MPTPRLLATAISGLPRYGQRGLLVAGRADGRTTAKVVPRRVKGMLKVSMATPSVQDYLFL